MGRILFILANLTLVIISIAVPEIVIPNGDFEEYDTQSLWDDWEYGGGLSESFGEYEEFDTWEGYGAFLISEEGDGDYFLYQDISADTFQDGATYLLTCKIKTKDIIISEPGYGVGIKFEPEQDGPSANISPTTTRLIVGTQEWTTVQIPFRADHDDVSYRISAGLFDAEGEAWFDDIRIIRLENMLDNPDFEVWLNDMGYYLVGWQSGGTGSVSYIDDDGLTGARSLKATSTNGTSYRYQEFAEGDELTAYRDYLFEARIKAGTFIGDGAYLEVDDTLLFPPPQSEKLADTDGVWRRLEVPFTAMLNRTYRCRLVTNGEGIANFDRARLRQLTVSDGDFDYDLDDYYAWERYQKNGEVIIENGYLYVYHDSPAEHKHARQPIELMKGSSYRITWKVWADNNDIDGGHVFVGEAGDILFEKRFVSDITPQTFDGFFIVPSVDLDEGDSVTTYVNLDVADGYASKIYYDDVFIEKVSERSDLNPITVVPQPQAVMDLGFDTFDIDGDEGWQIHYYQNPATIYNYGFDVMAQRFAENLAFEFDVGGDIVGDEREPLDVSALPGSSPSKAIVIGEYKPGPGNAFKTLVDSMGGVSQYVMDNPEGYEIFVEQNLIVIAASDTAGAQYGAETLLQYLKEIPTRQHEEDWEDEGERYATVPCGHIYDWPDYPWRAVWMVFFRSAPADSLTGDYRLITTEDGDPELLRAYIDYFKFLASMKINRVYFDSGFYTLEEEAPNPQEMDLLLPENQSYYDELLKYGLRPFDPLQPSLGYYTYHYFSAFFEMCRAYHIEPIPIAGGYSHAQDALEYIPTMVEGQYIGLDETPDPAEVDPYPRKYETGYISPISPYVLDGRFVTVSPEVMQGNGVDWFRTDVEVFNDQWQLMTEGQDYVLDYVEPSFQRKDNAEYPYGWYVDWENSPWGEPFIEDQYLNARIRVLSLYDGDIYVKYNHVCPLDFTVEKRFNASPASVEYRVYTENLFDMIFERLSPLKYIMNRHGEIFQMSTDGRSRAYDENDYPGLNKNAQLYLKSVWFNYDTIQAKNDLHNSSNPDDDVRVILWDDPILRSHDNLKGNPLTNHHAGQMGGGGGDISEPMELIPGAPPKTYDSAFEYLPEDTIIGCWNFSVEHLYHEDEVVGPPGDTETLDFDVEVSDWIKYRYLEEIIRGEYYEAYEPADFTSSNRMYHQRKYDAVFHYNGSYGTYYGPWYTNAKDNSADEGLKTLAKKSHFKAYGVDAGVTVGVDFYEDGEEIYTEKKEYESENNKGGQEGRAWNTFITEGSYYGIPWGREEESNLFSEEWHQGWRNLRIGGNGRHYPAYDAYGDPYSVPQGSYWDPIYGNKLDAQYYLRFNGAVRKRVELGWGALPDAPFNGDKVLPDPADYFKDEQWPGAAGKAWLDWAIFEESDEDPEYIDEDHGDGDFEDAQTQWIFANAPYIRTAKSDIDYLPDHSGMLERYDNPNPSIYGALNHDEMYDINDEPNFEDVPNESVKISGRLRTKLADCQRMHNPWQWHLSALEVDDDYAYDEDEDDGRILGPLNEMMTNKVFPGSFAGTPGENPATRLWWKPQISDINVAEWGWSAYKPYVSDDPDSADAREDAWETPKLYNFWYRPIFVFESESVRHEKKAICNDASIQE